MEGLQVHGDVEGQAMERAAATHTDAERADLGTGHVHAGGAVLAIGVDVPFGQRVDHRLLDPADVVAHADLQALQVEQRVRHDLTGPVIGHLAAAVDVHHRDVARRQHVLVLAGLPEGEHRIVLDQPQLVDGGVGARIGEALHGAPHRLIRLATQFADDARRAHSVHFTSG